LATFSKQAEEKAKAQQQGSAFQPPSMERVKKQQQRLEEIIRSVEEDYPKGITQEQLTPLFLEFHYTDSMKNINKVLANREAIMADPKKMKSWQEVSMMDILQVEGHLKNKFENTKTIDSKTAALMMKDDHWMMNMDEQTADDLNKFLELKYGKDLMMGDEGEEGGPKYELVTADGQVRKLGSFQFSGDACAKFPNMDMYEGHFVEGVRQGRGCYRYFASGDKYEGAFVKNQRHGLGCMTYNGKGEYQGYWENGFRHGEGVFTYASGDVYSGWWRHGKKEGTGSYYSSAQNMKLTGEWKDNKMVDGCWELPNGNRYHSTFNENKPDGEGCWMFTNGNELRGKYAQVRGAETEDENGEVKPGELNLEW